MTKPATPTRLRYDDGCLAAQSLNVIGDRWALLVVRELMFTPKRFQKIRAGLPGITASVLTGRLVQLAQAGVVEHDEAQGLYALSAAGRALLPVLEALCRWALCLPGHDPSRFISASALMISMGVKLLGERAVGQDLRGGFVVSDEAFALHIVQSRLDTVPVAQKGLPASGVPFVLHGTGNTLAAAVYGPHGLRPLLQQGLVRVDGDVPAAENFVSLFDLAEDGAAH